MCGGAIISDFDPLVSRSSRRLTAELLWGNGFGDLSKKRSGGSSVSKPLTSQRIVDSYGDFEADFLNFDDSTDDEARMEVKNPLSKNAGSKGSEHFVFTMLTFFALFYTYMLLMALVNLFLVWISFPG